MRLTITGFLVTLAVAILAKSNPEVLTVFLGAFGTSLIAGFVAINIDYLTGRGYILREPSEALWLCILSVSFLCSVLVLVL